LQLIASPESLQQVVFWLFGSLQKSNWSKLAGIALSLAICLPFIWKDVWQLTSLKLGDVKAQALGINVKWLRIKIFILISILTGVAVAFVGTIGFIGLVAPHIARMLLGEDQRTFLPACAIFGALLLSLASVMSKVVSPGAVFPIGIMTSLVGVPFFMFMVKSHKRSYW
jgi:iron complex transport system permease protein